MGSTTFDSNTKVFIKKAQKIMHATKSSLVLIIKKDTKMTVKCCPIWTYSTVKAPIDVLEHNKIKKLK